MAKNNEVVLFNSWQSPFGARVRIALEEKGIKYEYKEEDLFNKSSLLLSMNPVHKKIPVLTHKGKPICESLAIVEYIDEVWEGKSGDKFLPSDPYMKAQARFWADYIDKTIYVNIRKIWLAKGEEVDIGKHNLIESLKVLEKLLGDQTYYGGETFGLVDIALIGFYTRFYTVEIMGGFNIEEECPKLVAWAKRCLKRESVPRSLPDPHKVHDFCLELKEKLSIE